MQQSYAGQKLRVFIEPEDAEDLAANIPDPPFANEITEQIRQEVHRRHAVRQKHRKCF